MVIYKIAYKGSSYVVSTDGYGYPRENDDGTTKMNFTTFDNIATVLADDFEQALEFIKYHVHTHLWKHSDTKLQIQSIIKVAEVDYDARCIKE